MRGEEEDEIEEGVSTRSGPRMKHASNVGSSSIGSKGMCFA
jgi:hypothetical protein